MKEQQAFRMWRISRIRGAGLLSLGTVYAPDEAAALKLAAEQFDVPRELRDRLVAKPA